MPTNSTETYDLVGLREELTDAIYNVDPTETPFISAVGRGKANATLHEWQTDVLGAPAANAQVEGADAVFNTAGATVRLGNYTQIMTKTVRISGTLESVNKAGRKREMAYQLIKRGLELRRDMEYRVVQTNDAQAAGNDTTARELGGLKTYIGTNDSFGGGAGASPVGANGTAARTDGDTRAFTETLFTDVLDLIYEAGGKPNMVLLTPKQKRIFTGFDGNAGQVQHDNKDKTVINAVDIYVSDYGTLKVMPTRVLTARARDVYILQTDMWTINTLRDIHTKDIAKIGDADRKQMLVEFTLVSKNEKSSGGVFDLA